MLFRSATVNADGVSLTVNLGTLEQRLQIDQPLPPGRKVTAGIRPEHFRLTSAEEGTFRVPVAVVESTGSATYVTTLTEPELTLVETGRSVIRAGETIGLSINPDQVHVFDAVSGMRLLKQASGS